MTLGEKLKSARKESGLSQEQLAEKLSVSRSAVAKWESDKGMPDIENLKSISALLKISIDYLLSDEEKISFKEMKEPINLSDYSKSGKCRSVYDAVAVAKFNGAESIIPLIRRKKNSKIETILEWTIMPTFGVFETVDKIEHNESWYIIEKNSRQYLVSVSKEFIISQELAKKIYDSKFTIGNNVFKKTNFNLAE